MHASRATVFSLAIAALVSACATTSRTETVSGGDVAASVAGMRWTAQLTPENQTTVMGSVVVEPTTDPRRMQVRISIQGAPPNVNLPWHVRRGTCTTDIGAVGGPTQYPMLGTSMDGRAQLQTVLTLPDIQTGTHVVKVYAGPSSETVIACGDLTTAS